MKASEGARDARAESASRERASAAPWSEGDPGTSASFPLAGTMAGKGREAGAAGGAGAGAGAVAAREAEAGERQGDASGGAPAEEASSRGVGRKPPVGRRRARTRLSLGRQLHSASSSSLVNLPGAAEDPGSLRARPQRQGSGGWLEAEPEGRRERGRRGARWSRHSSPGASPASPSSDSLGAFDSEDDMLCQRSTDANLLSRDLSMGSAPSLSTRIAEGLEAHAHRLHAAARPVLWRLRGLLGWRGAPSSAWGPLSLCCPARRSPWHERLTPMSSSSGGGGGGGAPADAFSESGAHGAEHAERTLPPWRCPWPVGGALGKFPGVGSRYAMLVVLLLGCICLLVDINLARISTRRGPRVHLQHPKAMARQGARQAMAGALSSASVGALGAPGGGFPAPSTTMFCVPEPFEGARGARQREAVLSWLHGSSPPPHVVLVGSHPTLHALARELAPHVTVEERVDRSFAGTPLVNSVLARALRAATEVSVLVGPDVILLGSFFAAVAKLAARRNAWLMTGVAWDTPGPLPFSFSLNPLRSLRGEPLVLVKAASGAPATEEELAAYVGAQGSLRTSGPVEFCAWNNLQGVPLIKGPVPPFAHGHGSHYSWLVHEAALSGLRAVVDASLSATSIRVQLGNASSESSVRDVATRGIGQVEPLPRPTQANSMPSFEVLLNEHLSYRYGTNFSEGKGTARHAPWKLARCVGPGASQVMCLMQRVRPGNCSCEDSSLVHRDQLPMRVVEGRRWQCGTVSASTRPQPSAVPGPQAPPGRPHTLQGLLQEVAPKGTSVVLTGLSGAYLPLLRSFACQLRQLQVSPLIVAAYDEEAYVGAFEQGLAVYYEPAAWNASEGAPLAPVRCTREQPCVASQFAAFKAAAIARVLDAGHGVLWSDVDVVWRTDALPLLEMVAKGVSALFLEAQEDPFQQSPSGLQSESRVTQGQTPGAAPPPLDTGCFFLPHTNKTAALMHSLRRQALSLLGASEQRMYVEELCGLDGSRFDPTVHECVTLDGLGVLLFSPWLAARTGHHHRHGRRPPAAVIVHATGVPGVDNKTALLKAHGAWHYSEEAMMCIQPWHTQS